MEFFERIEQIGLGKKSPAEKAAQTLSKLATAIADAPDAADLEVCNYTTLYTMRVEKAKRAYSKAVHAMATNEPAVSIDHAERGLLHLQLASIHGHTEVVAMPSSAGLAPPFPSGGCEEAIQLLADAICLIKLLAEYKNIELTKDVKGRLLTVVQYLQDAIENYGTQDQRLAFDTAIGGLVWCQYIYARLANDALYPAKQQGKTIRGLYRLAQEAGIAGFDPVGRQTKDGRKKIAALEEFLQSALNAYFEDDAAEMENFVRLGGIEATSLTRYVARVKTKDLVSDIQTDSLSQAQPTLTFKQISAEIGELIDRHHPQPDRAWVALEALRLNVSSLRRALRAQRWPEATSLVESCRHENETLSREISKMIE